MAESKREKRKAFLRKHIFIVVFIVALLIAGANYLIYPLFISKNMGLIDIPIANETIPECTKISEDMITFVSMQKDLLPKGIVLSKDYVVGSYVKANTFIPTSGFFYAELLTDEREVLGTAFGDLEEGEAAYIVPVDTRYAKGSVFKENQLVDFYFYTYGETEEDNPTYNAPFFGLLAENVRIIAVSSSEDSPYLTLALSEEDLSYFQIAEQWTSKNGGGIYPLVNYKSSGVESKTNFYDIDRLHNWLKERSYVFELTDEEKNEGESKAAEAVDDFTVEIISDGGSED